MRRLSRETLVGLGFLVGGALAAWLGNVRGSVITELGARVWPVLLFVVAITVVAELAAEAGVFEAIARTAARGAGRRALTLWLLVVALAVVSTIFLSLDTTAVLVTPIVVMLAKRLRLNPIPYALTTVWLANTASMLLPVSNLSNLLAHEKNHWAIGDFVARSWPLEVIGIAVPCALIALLFRRDLAAKFEVPEPFEPRSRALFWGTSAVLAALAVALVSGLPAWIPAVIAAVILCGTFAIARPGALSFALVPWPALLLCCGLFLAATVAGELGLSRLLATLVPDAHSPLALGISAAVVANLANNLPGYLILEPHAEGAPALFALLAGVNMGPLVTPWASLATLLWHDRLQREGVEVRWGWLALWGAVVAVFSVGLSIVVLTLMSG